MDFKLHSYPQLWIIMRFYKKAPSLRKFCVPQKMLTFPIHTVFS